MAYVLLHIGTAKTGTTYLQRLLADLSPQLRERGILYPQAGRFGESPYSHHRFVWQMRRLRGVNDSRCWDDLRAELEQVAPRLAVLSCEGFYSFDDEEFGRLLRNLEGHDLSALVYFRNPADFMLSLYKQAVKSDFHRYHRPLRDFLQENMHLCDYSAALDRWEAALGPRAVRFRLYDAVRKSPGIDRDFLSALDCEDLLTEDHRQEAARHANPSPSDGEIRMFHRLNRVEHALGRLPLVRPISRKLRQRIVCHGRRAATTLRFTDGPQTPRLYSDEEAAQFLRYLQQCLPDFLKRLTTPADREAFTSSLSRTESFLPTGLAMARQVPEPSARPGCG